MTDALNQVDLCFVIDTTGSMGPFLAEAKRQLLATLRQLRAEAGVDLRVGLVEYRDHPPEERTFAARGYELTADLDRMQKVINGLKADGGGDAPEAVYDGIERACAWLQWRAHSSRFLL